MDAQNFMYWALGGGFLLLVLFICIAIFYVIRILKDLSDTTASVRDTAETVNENVQELSGKVTSAADQLLNYVVKPFAMFQFLSQKLKPFIDMIPQTDHAEEEDDDDDDDDDDQESPKTRGKKKRRYGRRKKKD